MYEFLRGDIVRRGEGQAVLEVGGVGYVLAISASTLAQMPPSGSFILLTHLVVREDRQDLYGFAKEPERHLFRQLLLVSGVGPAVALGLLSTFEPAALASHIVAGDTGPLTRAKGIGKRTAERIVVELRDRLKKHGIKGAAGPGATGVRADAVLALCSLGLARTEAESRIAAVKGEDLDLETLVKEALQ